MSDSVGYGNPPKATQFLPGNSASPGRKKGSKNRSTVARQILAMTAKLDAKQLAKLRLLFPDIDAGLSVEEVMTLGQISRAISRGSTEAYKAVMDSAYGKPKQPHEHSGEDGGPITVFELPKKQ